ncbi:hypothetical protein PspLS_09186 [Pyricularia sp. CBS 133598]|nr:hypothetical protein PspLS_09186 [Pyricularia sp. CBS 133598]
MSGFRFACGCSNPRFIAEAFDGYCDKHGGASERSVAQKVPGCYGGAGAPAKRGWVDQNVGKGSTLPTLYIYAR